LTAKQWERLEPHLPREKPKRGSPNRDLRRLVNGMLWVDRTGAPWRGLPECYGPWRTVASRFYRWQKGGVWDRVLKALQSTKTPPEGWTGKSSLPGCDHSQSSSTHRRGKRGDPKEEALGCSQGGFSTKVHLRSEGGGKPMVFFLSKGQRN
jgi:transposase